MGASTATSDIAKAQNEPASWPWVEIFWFGLLLLVCFGSVLYKLGVDWTIDEDVSHGFFVPLVAAYIVWQKREELLSLPAQPNRLGLVVLILGGLQLWIATVGVELFLARAAFIISLSGAILALLGYRHLRLLAFPLFLLFFMIPLPSIIYNQITFPLQLLASRVAETVLSLLSIPVLREGNILELAQMRLSVVEACSGIRSLLSLSFLSLVYAHFFDNRTWMKPVLLLATIPVAVFANASRVTITGILAEIDPELTQGFFHSAEGFLLFAVACVLLGVVHRLICLLANRFQSQAKA